MANVYGVLGADTTSGGAGADYVSGGPLGVLEPLDTGADSLNGLGGDDTLRGWGGADSLLGGDGADSLVGDAGNDSLTGAAGADTLDGGAGSDAMAGGQGDDVYIVNIASDVTIELPGGGFDIVRSAVTRGLGTDFEMLVLTGAAGINGTGNDGANTLIGNAAANRLQGAAGNDSLVGDEGADTLEGGNGADTLLAGTGNNSLSGGADADSIQGGAGADTMSGGGGNDTLIDAEGADRLLGGTGDDRLQGADLVDAPNFMDGEAGNDTIGRAGDFTVDLTGDTLRGGADNDLILLDGHALDVLIDGGAGADTLLAFGIILYDSTSVVGVETLLVDEGTILLSAHHLAGIKFLVFTDDGAFGRNVGSNGAGLYDFVEVQTTGMDYFYESFDTETVRGSAAGEFFYVGWGADSIDGGGGNDTMDALSTIGQATFIGGAGDDSIIGHGGDDLMEGGEGNDTILDSVGPAGDILRGGGGDDLLRGAQANDGPDLLEGRDGDDTIGEVGGGFVMAHDTLLGGFGEDRLEIPQDVVASVLDGGGGNDTLYAYLAAIDALTVIADIETIEVDGGGILIGGHQLADVLLLRGTAAFPTFDVYANAAGLYDFVAVQAAGLRAFFGTEDAETLLGSAAGEAIIGYGGGDSLDGGEGNDTIDSTDINGSGAPGTDSFLGGAGDDSITGRGGDDLMEGGAGNDTILDSVGLAGDILLGGGGNDLLRGVQAPDGPDLLDGGEGNDTIGQVGNTFIMAYDTLLGGADDDRLEIPEDVVASVLDGGGGNDMLYAYLSAIDALTVIAGIETIEVDGGGILIGAHQLADVQLLRGTAAFPTFDVYANAPGVYDFVAVQAAGLQAFFGTEEADTLRGSAAGEAILGHGGADSLDGGEGNDTINGTGTTGAATLLGGAGDDWLLGGADGEGLDGGADADTLNGGGGADTLGGGAGNDLLTGGDGIDMVVFDLPWSSYVVSLPGSLQPTGNTFIVRRGDEIDIVSGDIEIFSFGGTVVSILPAPDGIGPFTVLSRVRPFVAAATEAGPDEDGDPSTLAVAEDATPGTVIATILATDPNAPLGDTMTFELTQRFFETPDLSGRFALVQTGPGTAELRVAGALDHETQPDEPVWLRVVDARGNFDVSELNVAVLNVQEPGEPGEGPDLVPGTPEAERILARGGDDTILGSAGADTIDGSTGTDTLRFTAQTLLHRITPGASTADGAGDLYIDVERFEGSAFADTLIGSTSGDWLAGAGGDDSLDGAAGADTLSGGADNDSYAVNAGGDRTVENPGEGTDTVFAGITWSLGANLENLVLTGGSPITGTGNGLDNVIAGNGAANRLAGLDGNDTLLGNDGADTLDGGNGADSLAGGIGNDIYVVGLAADMPAENADEGVDTVRSNITWTLGAHLENLVLTGSASAAAFGNALDNEITGNAGHNRLSGQDGADTLAGGGGADTLAGGTGADVFRYGAAAEGADVITDFVAGQDAIWLSAAGFGGGLVAGGAVPITFGAAAVGAGVPQFLYDAAVGLLAWDADGAGGAAAQALATLTNLPALAAGDIVLVA
jgi:Ca2+-binding RTX toxin-like protein